MFPHKLPDVKDGMPQFDYEQVYSHETTLPCPDKNCTGFLIQGTINWHIMKCSICSKIWKEKTVWVLLGREMQVSRYETVFKKV